jgi:Putative Flp pilus-assembly TadE/G-like
MTARLRDDSGQVIPFVGIVLLAVLLAVCALGIDAGIWLKASRQAQSVADAAALAGVQDLPNDPGAAVADAQAYAAANSGTLDATPTVTMTDWPNDTITVHASETRPAYFGRFIGMGSQTVHATSVAQISAASTVNGTGYDTNGTGQPLPFVLSVASVPPACGCRFNQRLTLQFGPGSTTAIGGGQFGTLDFANRAGGTPPGTIASWITNGYPAPLAIGVYGVSGNKTVPTAVNSAMLNLEAKQPTVLLPVYSGTSGGGGGNMQYNVVGWIPFKLDTSSWVSSGNLTTLSGSFQHLQVHHDGPPAQYFGAGYIRLTK